MIQNIILLGIVLVFSIYSFGYATLDSVLEYKVMLVLSFLALLTWFPAQPSFLSTNAIFLYAGFLGLASVSVVIPFSEHAQVSQLIESMAMLLLATPIVTGFRVYAEKDKTVFKWGLLGCFLVLALLIILHQSGLPIKKVLPEFAGFQPVSHDWNQKYYSFWLVFLMWGTIALHWRKNSLSLAVAVGVILLTGIALFTGYSDSAPVAFVLSLVIFIFMHVPYRRWLRVWQAVLGFYIFALPWTWSLLPSGWLSAIKSMHLNNVAFRADLYSFSTGLILQRWFGGYGFGSAATLLQPFPFATGGHPHNIVLFFWLELGLLGAILLAWVTSNLLTFIHRATYDRENAPAVWALFGSGIVIFSFSFDIWLPAIVLTYAMWLAMIMLACQANPNSYSLRNVHTDIPQIDLVAP